MGRSVVFRVFDDNHKKQSKFRFILERHESVRNVLKADPNRRINPLGLLWLEEKMCLHCTCMAVNATRRCWDIPSWNSGGLTDRAIEPCCQTGWNLMCKKSGFVCHTSATVHRDLTLNSYHGTLQTWSAWFLWHCVEASSILAFQLNRKWKESKWNT